MGQSLSPQSITVWINSQTVEVVVPNFPITPRWLISETSRLSKNSEIIGLRTREGLELIDSLLSIPDKVIPKQIHIVSLQAIIQQTVSKNLSLDTFIPIKIIGNGGFCVVYMVLNKADGKFYAMKVMQKTLILQKNKTEQVQTELRIMESISHQFIVNLHSAFQTVLET